jgi:maltose/moltooligosaccharide transporter
VLIVIAAILVRLTVRERPLGELPEKRTPVIESLRSVFRQKDRSALLILVSIFLWFSAYWGIRPFITLYVIEYLGLSEGIAGLSTGMVAIAYLLFAIPSGMLAHRIGRRRVIRVSLMGMAVMAALMFSHEVWTVRIGAGQGLAVGTFWALLFLFGMFWGAANTNSFPMLWKMADLDTMGAYTGVYYVFSQAAAIVTPPLTGVIVDATGFRSIFIVSAVVMMAAFLVMGRVSGGEAE